ncbi:MAG: ABC transporter ATP-binding protein [Candidatus Levybacteria bacterium]|nr:ABC transporter ATP-binding protein [Candidatus Levybacteria bacterium]
MIKFQDVEKDYLIGDETAKVLKKINLVIKDGEFTSIVGPSGCGKSTMMHILGLLDKPTSGKVVIDDKDVSHMSDDSLSEIRNRYVGFIFQQFNLINKLSVIENVILPAKYSKSKIDFNPVERAEELLTRFGIFERRDYRPNKISGGQQQRVAIARALIMKPKLILADEPTGNLDSKSGAEILKLLGELNKDLKVTVLIVTHDKEIAAQAKRQIQMKDGEIVKS